MPLVRRKLARKPRRKLLRRRIARRVPRGLRKSSNVPDIASLSCKRTILAAGGANFAANVMYEVHNINLADYDRAVQVSQAYQHYRIKKVSLTFKFPYDTYQAAAGNAAKPNFYYMIDKSQSIPLNVTLEGLKQMGARPRACDNRPISVVWSPSVLTEDQALGGALPSQYKISPWLSTNAANLGVFVPSNVNHNGLFWYIDQMFAVAGTQYQVEIEVQFQFKKPLWPKALAAAPAIGVTVATLDDSKDGVVDGTAPIGV